jgi:hypothetical protein
MAMLSVVMLGNIVLNVVILSGVISSVMVPNCYEAQKSVVRCS